MCTLAFCALACPAAPRSAFYVGFTLTNLVGGYLASSVGTKHVLGWGVVLWSIFTITTPAAAGSTLPVLLGNRAMMGAGEGVTYPCVQNVVKFWCPADVRTRALVLIYSAGSVGTITALLTAPLIIKVGACGQGAWHSRACKRHISGLDSVCLQRTWRHGQGSAYSPATAIVLGACLHAGGDCSMGSKGCRPSSEKVSVGHGVCAPG